MADHTIEWLHGVRAQDAHKPFFAYFSTGCSHSPHHVATVWADRYKAAFDQGWDRLREETFAPQKALGVVPEDAVLTPRNEAFPAWEDVPDTLKPRYSRQMEVYAGFSENADHDVGRVIDAMQLQLTELYGGIDEWGGSLMDPRYSAAWAWAGNTPLQWGKQVGSHLGRTWNPLVVHWPERIHEGGGLRSQFTDVTDIAPTILDLAGIPEPDSVDGIDQEPMHGTSFVGSMTSVDAGEHRTQQYSETIGNHGMYKDGWWLAMKAERVPWVLTPDALAPDAPGVWDPDGGPAELYYLPDDFSEANDLAVQHPEKVEERKAPFWEGAERYRVLPLLAALSTFFGMLPPIPDEPAFGATPATGAT